MFNFLLWCFTETIHGDVWSNFTSIKPHPPTSYPTGPPKKTHGVFPRRFGSPKYMGHISQVVVPKCHGAPQFSATFHQLKRTGGGGRLVLLLKSTWWFQNIFYFHPYPGEWSNMTNIFQRGWNHQLEIHSGWSEVDELLIRRKDGENQKSDCEKKPVEGTVVEIHL